MRREGKEVHGVGNVPNDVLILGQNPGREEANRGVPFIGDSGCELNNRYLPLAGLRRSDVYIDNLYPWRTPDNAALEKDEIEYGIERFQAVCAKVRPKYVITVGTTSTFALLGEGNFDRMHGRPFKMNGFTVIPVYHPAAGIHSPRIINFILDDWKHVGMILRGEDIYAHRKADITGVVAVDTETVNGCLWSIQAASKDVTKFALVEDREAFEDVRAFIESATLVVYHNAVFDHKLIRRSGIYVERFTDTMQMLYLIGAQHLGLKTAVSRWLNREMLDYADLIKPYQNNISYEYLLKVAASSTSDTQWFKTKREANEVRSTYGNVLSMTIEPVQIGYDVTFEFPTLPDPEDEQEVVGKVIKTKRFQNIVKTARRILKEYAKNEFDLMSRWRDVDDAPRQIAELAFGVMPEATIADIPLNEAKAYAIDDAVCTLQLYSVLQPLVETLGLTKALEIDMGIIDSVSDMEENGLLVDGEYLKTFLSELDVMLNNEMQSVQKLARASGFIRGDEYLNPNSPTIVSSYLDFKRYRVKSTEAKYIEPLARTDDVIAHIMAYKGIAKLKTTYVEKLIAENSRSVDGRVRAHFNMTVTDTGRLSSSDPLNWQNIPVRTHLGKRVRCAVIAEDGHVFVNPDFSQIEIRVAAHLSGDKLMIDLLRNGADIHSETSDRIFGDHEKDHRNAAKRVGFGVMYGIGGVGLYELLAAAGLDKWTVEECGEMIESWFDVYQGIARYMSNVRNEAFRTGKVHNMFGRYRLIPEAGSSLKRLVSSGMRNAGNAPIQSTAADILKISMRDTRPIAITYNARLCNSIHDELMFEVPEDVADEFALIVKDVMENAVTLAVPIKVDVEIGRNWGEMVERIYEKED